MSHVVGQEVMANAQDIEATMALVGANEALGVVPGVRASLPFTYTISALASVEAAIGAGVGEAIEISITSVCTSTSPTSSIDAISTLVPTGTDVRTPKVSTVLQIQLSAIYHLLLLTFLDFLCMFSR